MPLIDKVKVGFRITYKGWILEAHYGVLNTLNPSVNIIASGVLLYPDFIIRFPELQDPPNWKHESAIRKEKRLATRASLKSMIEDIDEVIVFKPSVGLLYNDEQIIAQTKKYIDENLGSIGDFIRKKYNIEK